MDFINLLNTFNNIGVQRDAVSEVMHFFVRNMARAITYEDVWMRLVDNKCVGIALPNGM